MTAICAVKTEDGVWIGGDRAVSNCFGNTAVISRPKIFRNGPALMAFAGDPRPAQLVEFWMQAPELGGMDEFEWCVTHLLPAIQEVLGENGYCCDEESDFTFLVVVGTRIFTITPNLCVIETDKDYAAIGDGEAYSIGVLAALGTDEPEKNIKIALEAAAESCGSVLPPFDILKL